MPFGTITNPEEIQKVLSGLGLPLPKPQKVQEEQLDRRVIVIAGPTASGKTDLSLRLAQAIGGEIISADSTQVYLGMDIGTAKATLEQRVFVPHHLIDVKPVTQPFNAVDFYHEGRRCIEEIQSRGKIPIVVGGSGFYLRVLLQGPPEGPSRDEEVRTALEEEVEKHGIEAIYNRLANKDPAYAHSITPHDRQKIIRALEIMSQTGIRVSDLSWNQRGHSNDLDFHCWFIFRSREELYKRVEERVDLMLEQGLIEEVAGLCQQGIKENPSAARAIGYRQTLEYLNGSQDSEAYQEFIRILKRDSRRLVKQQFTWFRKQEGFHWLNVENLESDHVVDRIRQDFNS